MKKLISIVLAFVMTICLITPAFGVTSGGTDADWEISANEKVYSNATLDDNFTDDGVFVVLSNKASLEFKRFRSADFSEIGCVAVTDFSSASGKKIQTQVETLSKSTASAEELQLVDTAKIQTFNQVLYLKLANPGKQSVLDVIEKLMLRDDVIYAGPNYIYSLDLAALSAATTQNTLAYRNIHLWEAWEITTGSPNILVGVLDTGIDASHPDLSGRVNVSLSACFVNGAEEIGVAEDSGGHGTLVAGIIAGQWNNTNGIRGVAPNIRLVSLDVIMGTGIMKASDVYRAIDYADENNINILNFSAGWLAGEANYDRSLQAMIHNYSGLFVCAAGNGGDNNDNVINYPSCYNTSSDNIIVVGSSNAFDNVSSFSNYGSTVDIFAPGESITSTASSQRPNNDGAYEVDSGTSFSAPFVTGVAALLLSVNPSLTPQQIIARIILNSDRISILIDQTEQEVCRLNAYKSLLNATHLWAYTSKNLTQHTKACGCGESSLEYHIWIAVGTKYRCGSCGYITNALPGDFQNLGNGKTDCQACNHQ